MSSVTLWGISVVCLALFSSQMGLGLKPSKGPFQFLQLVLC